MAKKKWRGGPRSSLSYKMDQYRQSDEPWENKKGKKGVVKKHYSVSKRGRSFLVKTHRRRR